MIDIFLTIVSFLILVFVQALFINGVHYCFQGGCVNDLVKGKICSGNIFYKIAPDFFETYKEESWAKPLWVCVRCMSSFWGTITFWSIILMIFGFYWQEIIVWLFDVFCLVSVNWFIYQKL